MYYEEFSYDNLVGELKSAKAVGDEFTLMIASKWLRCNITVITSKRDWKVYDHCEHDIVLTYKGKDWWGRGKWTSSQVVSEEPGSRSKTASKYSNCEFIFLLRMASHMLLMMIYLIYCQSCSRGMLSLHCI